jgi:hypothetical protein
LHTSKISSDASTVGGTENLFPQRLSQNENCERTARCSIQTVFAAHTMSSQRQLQQDTTTTGCVDAKFVNNTFNDNPAVHLFTGMYVVRSLCAVDRFLGCLQDIASKRNCSCVCAYPLFMQSLLFLVSLFDYTHVTTTRMFTMRSKSIPIQIRTFELDVRNVGDDQTLEVEVYTVPSSYSTIVGDPTAWVQVANTKAVPVPGGGGILIPAPDFSSVSMQPNELRSFYITMKGPYLDSTAFALDKTGETDHDYDAFSIYVGAGLSEYKFPNSSDRTIDPKFAGVIYYDTEDCPAETVLTTRFSYRFLIDDPGNDNTMVTNVTDKIGEILNKAVADNDGLLHDFVLEHALEIVGSPQTESTRQDQGTL